MLARLYTLPSWVRFGGLAMGVAALLMLGGCTEDQLGDLTVSTTAGILASLVVCAMFHACHF